MMKAIFSIGCIVFTIFFTRFALADATCPALDTPHMASEKSERYGTVYSAYLNGAPRLLLKTDFDHDFPLKKFDSMVLTPWSPYFVSCSYNTGAFILKTPKEDFYDTTKTCQLVGAKPGNVQTTSVAMICRSDKVSGCRLVCS